MAKIGDYNTLRVVEHVPFGVYLDDGDGGKILLPRKYVPDSTQPDDELEVFVYLDSEDRPVATTEKPLAKVGQVAFLKVAQVTPVGAFLDWGLSKDLLVPFREQKLRLEADRWYVVFIYMDPDTDRIVASAKVDKFLDNLPPDYTPGQEVDLMVYTRTDLGYNVIVNNLHTGLIYHNEIFSPVRVGMTTKGYVKQVRDDERIDISLQPMGHRKLDGLAQQVLDAINQNNGFLPLGDKSPPEQIYQHLGISKKNFKKAIGGLLKAGIVEIESEGVRVK